MFSWATRTILACSHSRCCVQLVAIDRDWMRVANLDLSPGGSWSCTMLDASWSRQRGTCSQPPRTAPLHMGKMISTRLLLSPRRVDMPSRFRIIFEDAENGQLLLPQFDCFSLVFSFRSLSKYTVVQPCTTQFAVGEMPRL